MGALALDCIIDETIRGERLVLRPLQVAAIGAVRQEWARGHKNVLLQAPCGFGKTELATGLLQAANDHGSPSVFVCDRLSLIEQTSQRFDKYALPHGIIQGQNERWMPWRKVQLCSIQTLQRRSWPESKLIVADEAHVLPRALKERIRRRDCYTVGLTATPFTKGMGQYFDVVVNAATTNQLIREGLLCNYQIYDPGAPDMTGAKVNLRGEWDEEETEKRVLPLVGCCVEQYLKWGQDRKFIVFAVSVAHAEELQRKFLGADIKTALYTYRQTDEERNESVREFRKPDSYLRGLISIESLTRGFDVADVGVLILARPLRNSLSTHIQMIGRVLRTAEGKADAIILDHSGNCRRFFGRTEDFFENGVQSLDDGTKKEKKKPEAREREPMTCPKCTHLHRPLPMCPMCGHEYPRQSKVVHVPGQLSPLTGLPAGSGEDRQSVYSQLLYIQHQRGYKERWAEMRFQNWFGVKPHGLQAVLETPTRKTENRVRSELIAWAKSKERRPM